VLVLSGEHPAAEGATKPQIRMDTQGRKCAKQGAGLELPSVPQMPAHGSQLSTYCGIQGEQRQEENTEQPINSDGVIAAVAAA